MILMIDPPVNPFSTQAEIRAWIQELAGMRAHHAGDEEALGCIRRAESHATSLLALAASLPPITPPADA